MALVDEAPVVVGRPVGFVGCEVEVGVVAPRVVAVELHYRHQFYAVDTKLFDIVESVDKARYGAVAVGLSLGPGEVAYKHFVEHEALLRGAGE
ncbi:hypothetical protein IMSAG192_00687 [Muribaculaceae bacterium]|nr:hypothetical protein IMSAG192_00687 [Muribaculaceae bacterium]